jgi:hypothetical protein
VKNTKKINQAYYTLLELIQAINISLTVDEVIYPSLALHVFNCRHKAKEPGLQVNFMDAAQALKDEGVITCD